MLTAENHSPKHTTAKYTAVMNAETTAEKKKEENTTTNTTQKTKIEYTTNT